MRVLVGRQAVSAAAVAERRVDERDVRQRPRRAVGVVLGQRPRPRRDARAPHRRERQVGVVVLRCHPARERVVEDGPPLVAGGAQRRVVVLLAARLRGRSTGSATSRWAPSRRSGRRPCTSGQPRGCTRARPPRSTSARTRRCRCLRPGSRRAAARARCSTRARDRGVRSPATRPRASTRGACGRRCPAGRCRPCPAWRRPGRATRSSGRTSGSPSSRRRSDRSACCAGSAGARRSWRRPPRSASTRAGRTPRRPGRRRTRCGPGTRDGGARTHPCRAQCPDGADLAPIHTIITSALSLKYRDNADGLTRAGRP